MSEVDLTNPFKGILRYDVKVPLLLWILISGEGCVMKSRIGPNGVHFFDRNTGLNVLLDEFCPHQTVWSKSPRQVSVALT
ncbi:hypothetical protein Q6306_26160, partial [Klebsiella pneumoniae]|nr:hypothetical protein [Klebsiella pneumoniae]